jgi:ketopantoate reductase
LSAVDGKPLRNQTTKVRFFQSVRDVTPCQILFVCGKDAKTQEALDEVLKAVKGQTTLVVAEGEGALERGAAVRFTVVEGCVRFEINPTAVANARLEMSAKVQRLAVRVLASIR